jgi:hypothetical protein
MAVEVKGALGFGLGHHYVAAGRFGHVRFTTCRLKLQNALTVYNDSDNYSNHSAICYRHRS